MSPPPSRPPDGAVICSAKGCRTDATLALLWNNPTLHTPQRRKVWLACDEHAGSLSDFLSRKGFLKGRVPVSEITDEMG